MGPRGTHPGSAPSYAAYPRNTHTGSPTTARSADVPPAGAHAPVTPSRTEDTPNELPRNAADPTVAMRVLRTPRQRPDRPRAVLAAMVLVNLTGVGLFGLSLLFATLGPAVFFVPLTGAVLMGWLGRGIWRGSRGAYVIALAIAVFVALAGFASIGSASILVSGLQLALPAVLVALLTAQPVTRAYFWAR